MAHFAELDQNNIVKQVIVVSNEDLMDENGNESEQKGINFCKSLLGQHTRWVQTSYNAKFRKFYAGIGYTYDLARDAFIPPKPYQSWILNETTFAWDPPVPYPEDDGSDPVKVYMWDEATTNWVLAYQPE